MTDRMGRRTIAVALAGAVAALGMAIALRGFTVDDALITARYASHLARGDGYRFNAGGAITDGVTPLGWAYALAPFARGGPLEALAAAKAIGVAAWAAAAAALAVAIDRASARPMRFAALSLVAASAPLGAWSAAGMETGVVAALGALAVALPALGRRRVGAACAGVAAGLRPEMLPFALVVGAAAEAAGARAAGEGGGDPAAPGSNGARRMTWRGAAVGAALAAAPFLAAAAIRLSVFGRAAPLAALAKPADAVLGGRYALACFLLTGPLALVAPVAFRRLGAWPRGVLLAVAAHFLAIAAAGGDWMPLSRLAVPALPAVALGAAYVASVVDARVAALRIAVALVGELFVAARVGPAAARVGAERLRVIEALRGPLSGAEVVAALDIGWLGAATGATVVDLAGVTDPAIAALPGGHTTKRIPVRLLEDREVDTLVLLLAEREGLQAPWPASRFSRGVEAYVARFPGIGDAYAPIAVSEVPHLRYVVLRSTRHAERP